MPFCTGCGLRVDTGEARCLSCEAKAAGARGCPRCGAVLAGRDSKFCIACGAPVGPTAPAAASVAVPSAVPRTAPAVGEPVPAGPKPAPAGPKPGPMRADSSRLVEAARGGRAAVYQRLGRQLLTACYEGKLPYDRLPEELARQTRAGIESIRKGHASLAAAGICPRCLEPTLVGLPPACGRCGLVIPGAAPRPRP